MAEPSAGDLIARLPRTFGPSFNDQLAQWTLLFPAEQRRLRAQVDWLAQLPPAAFKRLFEPIVALESKMDLPPWDPSAKGMSVTDVGILARSPLYPQWRTEVAKVFATIDEGVGSAGALPPMRRLLMCVLPAGLPPSKEPWWPSLAKGGAWVDLDRPFGRAFPALVASVVKRKRPAGVEDIESTWIFESDARFTDAPKPPGETVVSWKALEQVRREFLNRLNAVRRDLHSVDQTNVDLKRLDIGKWMPEALAAQPRVREFIRGVMLSGNGSLVFPSSFVQWGASEAMRRAEPQAMIACFGIRQRLKPFSSSVLFEDQRRSNPTADADDPAGSLVDALMLAEYVRLTASRIAAYGARTLTIMTGEDLSRMLVLGVPAPKSKLDEAALRVFVMGHIESEG